MENLNEDQIIEALEAFIEDECFVRTIIHDALDLIKKLQAKNKRLEEENKRLKYFLEDSNVK